MNTKELFARGGMNPDNGFRVRDWFACGSMFAPQPIEHEGERIFGPRVILALDLASGHFLRTEMESRHPRALVASEVIPFVDRVCEEYGGPMVGWIFSHTCWCSSLELAMEDATARQGEYLEQCGVEFGPMADREMNDLREWAAGKGFKVVFDESQIE